MKKKRDIFSDTAFDEDQPIAKTKSPYEDIIKDIQSKPDYEGNTRARFLQATSGDVTGLENKKLRLECIKLALVACSHQLDDDQLVLDTIKRFWHFTRTGG